MTALAAYIGLDGQSGACVLRGCERMLGAQAMYGSNAAVLDCGAAALGRRLHPLLPEDVNDGGVIVGRKSGLVLAADVRLDNREELVRSLGLQRSDRSDSEIVLEALESWGEEAIARLIGDFALIAWSPREQSLLLARDYLGNRPLHFHRGRGFVAVASMPKGLHALPDIPRAVDPDRMLDLLALIPQAGTETYYEAIERVEPAHWMRFSRDGVRSVRYWKAPSGELKLPRPADYAEAIRERFDEAVAARLRSTAPIGSHLSSGLDSSSVTASAAIQLAARGERLTAFTAVPRPGFDGSSPPHRIADEAPLAGRVAALYPNVDHVTVDSGGRPPLEVADRYVRYNDRPPVNLCQGAWGEAINEAAAARGISTMLTAQGGNMTLSFDANFVPALLLRRGKILQWVKENLLLARRGVPPLKLAGMTIAPFLSGAALQRVRRLLGRSIDLEDYSLVRSDAATLQRLAGRGSDRGLDFRYPRPFDGRAREWVLRRADRGNFAKGTLAASGVDLRDPTTDRRLLELCWSIPVELYCRGGQTRALARKAFESRLPAEVVANPARGYQGADWYMALDSDREGIASAANRLSLLPNADSIFDVERIVRTAQSLPTGGWNEPATINRYRHGLMRALAAGAFIRQVSGSNV